MIVDDIFDELGDGSAFHHNWVHDGWGVSWNTLLMDVRCEGALGSPLELALPTKVKFGE